jgi:hypothetical protein
MRFGCPDLRCLRFDKGVTGVPLVSTLELELAKGKGVSDGLNFGQ